LTAPTEQSPASSQSLFFHTRLNFPARDYDLPFGSALYTIGGASGVAFPFEVSGTAPYGDGEPARGIDAYGVSSAFATADVVA
jgi:hypothetical protein